MNKNSKIFVTGHRGLAGSAITRYLSSEGYTNIVTVTRGDVDLSDPAAVKWLFSSHLFEYIFHCAAKVGGIMANQTQPVEFMLENLRIQDNVLSSAKAYGVKKLLFLSSACSYPRLAPNPLKVEYILTGPLEPSNECYALAKICGVKLCQAYQREYGCRFISAMLTNLYGIGDNYHPEHSHVVPGMIRRIHEAKQTCASCRLWGSGTPTREFLFSDDLAQACHLLMNEYEDTASVNISSGAPVALRDLASFVRDAVGYGGDIEWDTTKPDGTPDRQMDITRIIEMGWSPEVGLHEGLRLAYQDFLSR